MASLALKNPEARHLSTLTAQRLREVLDYNPDTGAFVWRQKISNKTVVGRIAGSLDPSGYVRIRLENEKHPAHRLVILHVTGEWPEHHVDHANGDKADNRYANLRQCTSSENNANRPYRKQTRTGVKGVTTTRDGTYEVRIGVDKRRVQVGTFATLDEAKAAYAAAALRYHGEFARVD